MTETRSLVCIVDDDDMVRESIRMLAAAHGYATRGYANCLGYLADPERDRCDCLILDVRLPGIGGPELQERLAAEEHTPPIIFISGHGTVPLAVKAMRLGALDFLQKPFDEESLLDRIRQAVVLAAQKRRELAEKSALAERHNRLTRREKEVMAGLARGLASKQIAEQLGISTRTVEQYRTSLRKKLDARSLAAILRASASLGEACG